MNDWEVNPDAYLRDSESGELLLKADGTPKKKPGRPKGSKGRAYNYHSETKAKLTARRTVRNQEKKVAQVRTQLRKKEESLEKSRTSLQKIEGTEAKTAGKIVDNIEDLPESLKTAAEENVIFSPNDGPQTDFLAAAETDVLYGGAAGGGKSYAMLVDPLRFAHRAAHRALILRRSMPELREIIDKSRELYPKAFPGSKYKEVEKLWNFPSGAKVEFGFLERDADVYRYQGQAYSWIGFDEITHLPTEFSWNYLASPYMRCTANPGGVGSHWVKKRYVTPYPPNESFRGEDGLTRKFIPARLMDNPYLAQDGRYEQMLKALPPTQRKQLLEGDWDVAEGAAFTEFDRELHIVDPFEIPLHWERIKGIDYGYASESACIWGAVDPSDSTLIIYRELYRKGMLATELATTLMQMEAYDPLSVPGVLDTACWSRTGMTGPTVGETLVKAGHKLRRADKNRVAGKVQIHEYLKTQPSGRPRIQIFNSCPNLIRELQSIPLDKNNPEDVDTHASDHAYDALRYLIMSRPRINDPISQMRNFKREINFQPSDSVFGY